MSTTRHLSELPVAVLARILQHVPQHQRLQQCALVSRAWSAAADMTTVQLQAMVERSGLPANQRLIDKHSCRLSALDLHSGLVSDIRPGVDSFVQLPCSQLLQLCTLDLHGYLPQLQVSEATSTARSNPVKPLLPGLRHLRLSCSTCSSRDSLLQLTQLGSVTELKLASIRIRGTSVAVAEGDVLGEAVQQLLLSMQQLARLSMSRMHLAQGSIWQLPSRLTYLSFYAVEPPVTALGQSCLAQSCLAFSITTLPQLQVLDLARSSFYPTVLESMPQLQSLSLDSLYLLPRAADAEGQPGDATFLSAVGTLHHLKHLRLFNTLEKDADLQQYSGLAACSQLTALLIAVPNAMPLPCGAVQHIFQSGRPLLQLQSLELPGCIVETGGGFNAAELRNIMRACPGLRHLDIVGATGAGASQALLELPASCSSLMVGSLTPDDASAQVVATLTQLKQLFWHDAQDLTDTGFEQLTALTALTRLFVYDVLSLSAVVAGEDLGKLKVLSLTTSTKPPEEPDVWKQVRGRCSQARAWRQRMSVELQETQNLQQQVRDLQQQNCELQQQNVWLQQQNVWLEQQNSELQQQLAQLIS